MHAQGCARPPLDRLFVVRRNGVMPERGAPPAGYEHEVVDICGACEGAVLERLKVEPLADGRTWDQAVWFELSPRDGHRLRGGVASCPAPLDPACPCALHWSLAESARALPSGSWNVPLGDAGLRHRVTLVREPHLRFELAQRKSMGMPVIQRSMVQWSNAQMTGALVVAVVALLLGGGAYLRWVDWPLLADVVVALFAIPLSVALGVAVVGAASAFRRPSG